VQYAPDSGDEQPVIEKTIVELVDQAGCHLVLTTGGTGPAERDVTPRPTLAIALQAHARIRRADAQDQPGIRAHRDPVAPGRVIRYRRSGSGAATGSLIINLPGQPKSIRETLEGLKDQDGKQLVPGIFAAVPYCIDLIGGPYIETNADVIKAFPPEIGDAAEKGSTALSAETLEAIEIETAPDPRAQHHLDARPRRRRQRFRAPRR